MLIALYIVIVHWIADFVFQAEDWANNKSTSNSHLFAHVITYSTIWLIPACFLLGFERPNETTEWYVYSTLLFFILTFLCHFITDYITSRIVKRRFEAKYYGSPIPNLGAFTVIGFDQVLHYAQLFLTYHFLTQ